MKTQAIDWSDIPYVLAVCKTGSLSAAARELSVNHSTVFRRIERVEAKLGVVLFERLNNGYVMTEAGEFFYQNASELDSGLNSIQSELRGQDTRLKGGLSVTTTDSIAYCLSPLFAAFQNQYPDIELKVISDALPLDLMQREADIAIRPTTNPPQHWLGRNLMTINFAPYAHKKFVADHINRPLNKRRWILLDESLKHSPMAKVAEALKHIDAPVTISSSVMSAFEMVKQSLGITVLPCYLAIKESDLVQIELPDPTYNWDIWLLSHPGLKRSARVHAFYTFASNQISAVLHNQN